MTVQLIAAIATVCQFSVGNSQYHEGTHSYEHRSFDDQIQCQKKLINCMGIAAAKSKEKTKDAGFSIRNLALIPTEGDDLAQCVLDYK